MHLKLGKVNDIEKQEDINILEYFERRKMLGGLHHLALQDIIYSPAIILYSMR